MESWFKDPVKRKPVSHYSENRPFGGGMGEKKGCEKIRKIANEASRGKTEKGWGGGKREASPSPFLFRSPQFSLVSLC